MGEVGRLKGVIDKRYSLSDKSLELSQIVENIVDHLSFNDYVDLSYDEDGTEEKSLYNEIFDYLESKNSQIV
jgi:predicted RNase H-related nuclease YkuK (DUF458 family)